VRGKEYDKLKILCPYFLKCKYDFGREEKLMKGSNAWWYHLGKPQYGGEIVIRSSRNIVNFDPYFAEALTTINSAWMERLVADDWTINPEEWDYRTHFRFDPYVKGNVQSYS
jgi:hypothetical protein